MKRAILGLVLLGVAPVSAMAADRDRGGRDGVRFEASIRIGGGHAHGRRHAPVVRHERVIEHRDEAVVVHREEPVIVHREETVIDPHGRAVVIDRHEPTVLHRDDVVVEHRYVPVDRHREVYVRPRHYDYGRRNAHHGRGH